MKVKYLRSCDYNLVRHWGKWYVAIPGGGIVEFRTWLKGLEEKNGKS